MTTSTSSVTSHPFVPKTSLREEHDVGNQVPVEASGAPTGLDLEQEGDDFDQRPAYLSPFDLKNGEFPETDEAVILQKQEILTTERQRMDAVGQADPNLKWVSLGPSEMRFPIDTNPSKKGDEFRPMNSGRVVRSFQSPGNENVRYDASANGLWKSLDGGKSWKNMTTGLASQSIGAIAVDPNNKEKDVLYVGLGDPFTQEITGLIVSQDGGETWSQPTNLVGQFLTATPGKIATRPQVQSWDMKISNYDSKVAMFATNAGLFRTVDGTTFEQVLPPLPSLKGTSGIPDAIFNVRNVQSVAEVGPGIWVAACMEPRADGQPGRDGIICRSEDNGKNWNQISLGDLEGKVGKMTIAVAPSTMGTDKARIYIQAADDQNNGQADILRSSDGGKTFEGLGVNKDSAPLNPRPGVTDNNFLGFQGFYNQAIAVDPTNPDNVIAGGQLGVAVSNDGGLNWSIASDWKTLSEFFPQQYVHADVHSIAFIKQGDKTYVEVGTDGGLFRTDAKKLFKASPNLVRDLSFPNGSRYMWNDLPVRWSGVENKGLNNQLLRGVSLLGRKHALLSGLQDNGTIVGNIDGLAEQIAGGDGWGVITSKKNPNVALISSNGRHMRTMDGGKTIESAEKGLPQGKGDASPFDVRYAAPAISDAFNKDGLSFLTIRDDPPPENADPSVPVPLKSRVYLTTNAGEEWTSAVGKVTRSDGSEVDAIPGNLIAIGAHPKLSNTWAAASLSNENGQWMRRIYLTQDGGQTYTESAVLDGVTQYNYPMAIEFDPADKTGKTFYVASGSLDSSTPPGFGTTFLVKTTDGGKTWSSAQGNDPKQCLPPISMSTVAFNPYKPTELYAGNEAGLYLSKDKGATWNPVASGMGAQPVSGVAFLRKGNSTGYKLIASTFGGGFFGLKEA